MLIEKTAKNRVFAAVFAGCVIGVVYASITIFLFRTYSIAFVVGIAAWYLLIAVFVAFLGIMTFHPIFRIEMPIWFRSLLVGGSLSLVLVMIAYPTIAAVLASAPDWWPMVFQYPWWIIPNGILAAYVIDFFATKAVGEDME